MWKKKNQNQEEEQFARNRLSRFLFSTLLLSLAVCTNAAKTFHFNKTLLVAQKQNYKLKLKSASQLLSEELLQNPDNSAIHYLLHFNAFMKAFITEEEQYYAAYRQVQNTTLLHLEDLPDSSVYKKFAQSEVYFYSATLKAKFNELYGAARDINRAYSLAKDNQTKFPHFVGNNKTIGVLQIYLSTVPDGYKWIAKVIGAHGNLNNGLRTLKKLAEHRTDTTFLGPLGQEASYIYSYTLFNVAKQPSKAWSEMLKCTDDYSSNLLSVFFRSNMALKLNKNATALHVLNQIPTDASYENFEYLMYIRGVAKQRNLQEDAIQDLMQFYTHFKGRNHIKSCLQKMSWHYLLQGELAKYTKYKSLIATSGYSLNEDDKQALLGSTKPQPNSTLLKTRLLYDGGHYQKAQKEIALLDYKTLPNRSVKAEFCYRSGRIQEKMGDMPRAVTYYKACTLFGIDSKEYYASYASIYLGDYYKKTGDKPQAQKYYEKALSFKENKEYVSSIEQRAKMGLKRLK